MVINLRACGGDGVLGGGHVAESVEHHPSPLLRQGQSEAQADATGGAGDKGGFAVEHGGFPYPVMR